MHTRTHTRTQCVHCKGHEEIMALERDNPVITTCKGEDYAVQL